jgi:hypothetical protein
LFFHIWSYQGKRNIRVLTSCTEGKNLKVLTSSRASHYCWLTDTEVILSTVLDGRLTYKKYDITSGDYYSLETWMPQEDGHPSVLSDRYIVTDTYPDKYGQQHLFLCDSVGKEMISVGSFYSSPFTQGEVRCDLHPRSAPEFNKVIFDSAFSGRRMINVLSLDKIISNQ